MPQTATQTDDRPSPRTPSRRRRFNRRQILEAVIERASGVKQGAIVRTEEELLRPLPAQHWIELYHRDWHRADIRERRALHALIRCDWPLADRIAELAS